LADFSALYHCQREFLSCIPLVNVLKLADPKFLTLAPPLHSQTHIFSKLSIIFWKAKANELNRASVMALLYCSIEPSKAVKDKVSLRTLSEVLSSSIQTLRDHRPW
jgi:hypothetical protein